MRTPSSTGATLGSLSIAAAAGCGSKTVLSFRVTWELRSIRMAGPFRRSSAPGGALIRLLRTETLLAPPTKRAVDKRR